MPMNLKGVESAPPGEPKEEKVQRANQDRLKKACADFESIFIRQIFQSMRQTLPEGGFIKGGPEKEIFQSLFDEELSKKIAGGRGWGLGEMLYKQLLERRRMGNEQ
jgi:peptidoglycan hydrolase FlgJ